MSTIRAARSQDIEAIIELCAEHAAYEQCEYRREGKALALAQFLFSEQPPLHCLVVEASGGDLLGYATYSFEFSTWRAGFFTHMDCLYLRPHARGSGLGAKLLEQIAVHTRRRGLTQMQWQTPATNERAIAFYLRLPASLQEKCRFTYDLGGDHA